MWFLYGLILSPFHFILSSLTTLLTTLFIRPSRKKEVKELADLEAAKGAVRFFQPYSLSLTMYM
jgi:hypothetical protein